MKAKYLCLNLVVMGALIACNLSNRVVENAIALTETAHPAPSQTPLPTQTPATSDTPEPTNTPEATQPPAPTDEPTQPAPVSLEEMILRVEDLNAAVALFKPDSRDTDYIGNTDCQIGCLARQYFYNKDQYRLEIDLGLADARESALALVTRMAAASGSAGYGFLPVPESVTLGENPPLHAGLNPETMPANFIILQIDSYSYIGFASIQAILIEMSLDNLSGNPIDPQEAAAIISYAMNTQTLNIIAALSQ